jgi:hypothetical protein
MQRNVYLKTTTVFRDVQPCSLAEVHRRFGGAYRPDVEAANTSEMSVSFYQTTKRNIPEDGDIHIRPRQKQDI